MAAVIGVQAAGGIMGAAGARESAAAQANYYNYIAAQNEVQAKKVLEQGQQEAEGVQYNASQEQTKLEQETKKLEGVQKTVMAAKGVWSNSRTAQDIATDTATKSERDAAALRYTADYNAWLARRNAASQASALRSQAAGYRFGADQSLEAGKWQAYSTLLGTAGQIGSTYASWSRYAPSGGGTSAPASETSRAIIAKNRLPTSSKLSLY
jgi:hypothetical protein